MSDTPRVTASLAALEAEAKSPEPFILALPDSRRITFPDLYDIPVEESEEFLSQLKEHGQNDWKFLQKWLSKEDFEAYKAAKVKLRVHAALMTQVLDYYQASFGKPGEGRASAS